MPRQSLYKLFPTHYEVPILIVAASICLAKGLVLPVLTFKEMVFWKHTFSVLSGIQSLVEEGHRGLAAIIFLFSVIFPLVKLSMLSILWFSRFSSDKREQLLSWISQMGKWSMLDVFVVAITIVITRMSNTASAEPRIGIYVFGASVLLAMFATMRVEYLVKKAH